MTLQGRLHQMIDERSSEWLTRQVVWLGDFSETVLTNRPGELYARQINQKVIRVYNTANVPATYNLQVVVGESRNTPGVWQIIGIRESYDQPAGFGLLAYHHEQHQFPNPDTVWVDRKQIVPLTVLVYDAAGFIVRVHGEILPTATGVHRVLTQLVDLSSYVVTAGAKFVNIEIDEEGVLSLHAGTVFAAPEVATDADIPVPDEKGLVAYILFYDGQTTLSNNDIRVPFHLTIPSVAPAALRVYMNQTFSF